MSKKWRLKKRILAGVSMVCMLALLAACDRFAKAETLLLLCNDEANAEDYLALADAYLASLDAKERAKISVELVMADSNEKIKGKDVALVICAEAGKDLDTNDIIESKALKTAKPFVLYNKTLFDEHNLTEPETARDFLMLISYMQMLEIEPLGFRQSADGQLDLTLLAQTFWMNNQVMDEASGLPDNPGYADLFNLAHQLNAREVTQFTTVMDVDAVREAVRGGGFAMMVTDTSDEQSLEMAKEDGFGSFTIPGSWGRANVPRRIVTGLYLKREEGRGLYEFFDGVELESISREREAQLNAILRLEIEREDVK